MTEQIEVPDKSLEVTTETPTQPLPPVATPNEEDLSIAPERVTMKSLLEAGVHFGHQTRRWQPRMKTYIFTQRNGIHIIDLQRQGQFQKM